MTKKVLAIHDISVVGKCSLSVIMPVISSCGVEVCPLPTALLSNHTAFNEYSFTDLSSSLDLILEKFRHQNFKFDAIYVGYLGTIFLVEKICDLISNFPKSKVYIDPVMGDNGKLYKNFSIEYISGMRKVIEKADVIFPNLTEACLLLGLEYKEYFSKDDIHSIVKKLSSFGPKLIFLTGVKDENYMYSYAYNAENEDFYCVNNLRVDGNYYGTGDIFASVIIGKLETNYDIYGALVAASSFCYKSILKTYNEKSDSKFGVLFETFLPELGTK